MSASGNGEGVLVLPPAGVDEVLVEGREVFSEIRKKNIYKAHILIRQQTPES